MRYPVVQEKSVLVTGCSSGIGEATAIYLREHGWKVLPTARKDADLEKLKVAGFDPIFLDVASSESVQSAASQVLEKLDGRLGALVNNSGFGQAGALEDVSREALRYQFEVNVFGAQELANCFIPVFRKQGWGRIVNISSVLGRITLPMVGSYCATKHAMESLSDALRIELRTTGIAVSLIEPGPIISNFRKTAVAMGLKNLAQANSRFGEDYEKEFERRRRQEKKPDLFTRPPEDVAVKILHAIDSSRPRRRYCVTIPAYIGSVLRRIAPDAFLDHLLARRVSGRKSI